MNEQELMQMAQAIANGIAMASQKSGGTGYGMKAPATIPTTNLIHGPGGLFGVAGIDNNVISLRIAPRGISSVLRAFPDVNMQPMYPYITGVVEDEGDEPATRCETCLSGEIEACLQTAQFGYICRETKTLEPSVLIQRVNSGEVDLTLVNDILGGQGDVLAAIRGYDRNTIFQVATALAMLEVGILFQNKLAPMYWEGNPANNVGTGYMEFPGLASFLISTGKMDALTGALCPALDSDVKDFAYQNVNAVNAAGNFMVVRMLSAMENYVYENAEGQSLLPVEWVWCMRPGLWRELTEIWPFAYLTTRNLVLPAGNTNVMDATRLNDMRDAMRSGLTLEVNGRSHRVVVDSGIFEHNSVNDGNLNPGEFASDIYLLPMTYLGSKPATYLQHKDYRLAAPDLRAANLTDQMWTDDGRFRWTYERLKFCYTLSGTVEPRVVLKTPQLAGRLNHVMYVPEQHERDWDQDSDYFYKGGVDHRTASTLYSEWNPTGR